MSNQLDNLILTTAHAATLTAFDAMVDVTISRLPLLDTIIERIQVFLDVFYTEFLYGTYYDEIAQYCEIHPGFIRSIFVSNSCLDDLLNGGLDDNTNHINDQLFYIDILGRRRADLVNALSIYRERIDGFFYDMLRCFKSQVKNPVEE